MAAAVIVPDGDGAYCINDGVSPLPPRKTVSPLSQHESLQSSAASELKPVIRSGSWCDVGLRLAMEDSHVRIDELDVGASSSSGEKMSYYGIFDGHGGKGAAQFASRKLLEYLALQEYMQGCTDNIEDIVQRAFLETDTAFAAACRADGSLSSGTTAITALVLGTRLVVGNAGDCRAVLCRRGKALDMSKDHKPLCPDERRRIEALGGFVDADGYLNGELSVARCLGDWHIEGLKGSPPLLTAEPQVTQTLLTEDDEFFILGCDGLWDVFSSQNAVDFARTKLQQHNDPEQCCRELVMEALRRDTSDNLTVVLVCFQANPPPQLFPEFPVRRRSILISTQSLQDFL